MKTTVVKLAMAALAVCAVVCTSSCNPENTGESNNDNVPLRNTVHNLAQVTWRNPGGTEDAISFDNYILDCIQRRDDAAVIHYDSRPEADYAVPTPEHCCIEKQ